MRFIWSDDYNVGIGIIDEQHKHFFEIANEISDLVNGDSGGSVSKDNLLAFCVELGNYALYHLGTEEMYFKKFNYPGAEEHITAHNQYRKKVQEYLALAEDKNADIKKLSGEIAFFSTDWLINHILYMDKKYASNFHSHGL